MNEQIECFNRKQDYSFVVQAVANASFKFLDGSTGFPGSIHDACILRLSKLHREVGQGNWLNGPSKQIGACEVGPFLVGVSAYPLSKWLMKPLKQIRTLTESQLWYNCALSQALVVIEQAYGILKGRWRCLYKAIGKKISSIPRTILACCVLHICIIVGDSSTIDPVEDDDEDEDSFHGDMQLGASDIRDNIMIIYHSANKTLNRDYLFIVTFKSMASCKAKTLLPFYNIHSFVYMYLLQYYCYCYLFNVKM